MTGNENKYSLMGLLAQGKIPWIERKETETYFTFSEYEFANKLSKSLEYIKNDKIDLSLIADTLNQLYHDGQNVRTEGSVRARLVRFRKKFKS